MLTKNQYKKDFITKSGYIVGGLWVGSIVFGLIILGIWFPFPYWWTLLFVVPINIFMYAIHIIISKKCTDGIDFEKNIKLLVFISWLQLLVLNIPLFAFGFIGSVFYNKTHYSL